jgi:hypothetical protein
MRSPFPGMDPYLEGYLWPDVYQALASQLRQQITPQLRPRYTARLAVSVIEDTNPEGDIGVMYPDVEVRQMLTLSGTHDAPSGSGMGSSAGAATPSSLTIPVMLPVEVQLTSIEIRDTAANRLVTSMEILSPVNKREPGLAQYRDKRRRLYQAGVHLIELDLIRRGTRPAAHPRLHDVPYVLSLTRAHSGRTEVWPRSMREPLPVLPVPLHPPDDDVVLDVQAALVAVYSAAAYDLSIDYGQEPPPPPLHDTCDVDVSVVRTMEQ